MANAKNIPVEVNELYQQHENILHIDTSLQKKWR